MLRAYGAGDGRAVTERSGEIPDAQSHLGALILFVLEEIEQARDLEDRATLNKLKSKLAEASVLLGEYQSALQLQVFVRTRLEKKNVAHVG